jgi:outer membrane protein OmpA-like peptidoglycan-associated protein
VVAQLERQFGGGEATTGSGIQKGADASGAGSAGGPGTAAETGRIGGSGTVAGDERITRAGSESPQSGTGDFQLDLGHGGSGIADSVAGRAGAVLDIPDQNIEIANVPEGVKLTIRDIRFVADSDQILPAERGRLDLIAQALKSILQSSPNKPMILVEGHTAAVGKPAGELELSVMRAKKIVDELVLRGIPAERFMYKGWGGTKPIADNTTEPGRAKNRRVEITILDGLSSN